MNYLLGDPLLIPPIINSMYGTAEEMLDMVKSLVLLVTTIFQDDIKKNSKDIIELRVRIFLTRFERFDAPMRKIGRKPTYITCYNYLCLLNLGDTIEEFGPMRRYFEGKWLGERYVKTVKDERSRCGPSNVYYTLMRNLQRSKAVDGWMLQNDNSVNNDLSGNVKVYGNRDEINVLYAARRPLSVVLYQNDQYGALFYQKGKNVGKKIGLCRCVREDLADGRGLHHGLRYWYFQLVDTEEEIRYSEVTDFVILLPRLGIEHTGLYTMVSKNWSTEMFDYTNFYDENDFNVNLGEKDEVQHHLNIVEPLANVEWC